MKYIETTFKDVVLLELERFEDQRGFFMESFNREKFNKVVGFDYDFVQDNHSLSIEAGTLRGLHYQLNPASQSKLVRVLAGAIYDVVVDIRQDSPTFGQWEGFILSDSNHCQLIVPKGFAHGFCTLVAHTQVFYKTDAFYARELDRGILWDDPDLKINWPQSNPILSEKDRHQPLLKEAEINF